MTAVAEYRAGIVKHAGEWFKFRVDDDGNWLAEMDGRDLKYQTRAALLSEIDRLMRIRKKAVNIPFTMVESRNNGYVRLKHGVVTGVHAGTGNLLVAWDDGSNGQIAAGTFAEVLQRLTVNEERELALLAKEANDSAEALRGFTNRKQVYKGTKGLEGQVRDLLEKAEKGK